MKKEGTKKTKLLLFANLFLLFMLLAIPTYAYWAGLVKGNNATKPEDVIIGEAGEIETTVGVTVGSKTTGALVPAGRATTGQVEEVTLEYNVTWVATNTGANYDVGSLEVKVENIKIDNNDANKDLVIITPVTTTTDITLNGEAVSITFKVTLTEPATKEIYEAVAGKTITFDLTFTVTPK